MTPLSLAFFYLSLAPLTAADINRKCALWHAVRDCELQAGTTAIEPKIELNPSFALFP
jgi:hypothetical protein